MKIISLELKGYKRLALNNIEYLKFTPENKIQLILGTNGSGKSSLLQELTPLPSSPTDFTKDGYKIITIVHNNITYTLKSIFSSSGNKFHFIKEDEELNTGHTVTIYKELVKKHFNITQDVHELLTGLTKFHEMSTTDRRSWFTRISEADYTFAFNVYNNLREQLRDIQGSIKLSQSRLVQESSKLLKPEEEKIIREEIKNLTELLHLFLSYKTPIKYTDSQLKDKLLQIDNFIMNSSKELLVERGKFLNLENFQDIDNINELILQSNIDIGVLENNISNLLQTIEHNENTLKLISETKLDSLTDLDKNLDSLLLKVSNLNKSLRYSIKFNDNKQASLALTTIYQNLVELFSSMESNSDYRYSKGKFEEANNKLNQIKLSINTFKTQRDDLLIKIKELDHLKTHDEVKCPKCEHKWFLSYNANTHEDLKNKISQVANLIISLEEEQIKTEEYITNSVNYFNQYKAYNDIKNNWAILRGMFEYLEAKNMVLEAPRSILNVVSSIQSDLDSQILIDMYNEEIKNLLKLRENISNDQISNIDKLKSSITEDNKSVFQYNNKVIENRNYIKNLEDYKNTISNIHAISGKLELALTARTDTLYEQLELARKIAINDYIQVVQYELSKREQLISKIDLQASIVKNLESQIIELNETLDVLKIAVKEISPTEGLIAKGLTGFINHFVSQVNSFIKKIWLYPMELIPIQADDEEGIDLDYKFAVKINNNNTIPDIKKASSGMKEVIDLAFVLVSMVYLKLEDSPIYLDEFAAKLDKSHRDAAFHVITNLITSANYSQIYMVSHYENSYGSLKNSDITVLCPSNIILPKDLVFNRVTKMT